MTSTSRPISLRSAETVFCSDPVADCRRALAPEVEDEPVGGHDLAGAQRKRGEQRTLLPARQRDDPVAVPDLQRPKEADLHRLGCNTGNKSFQGERCVRAV